METLRLALSSIVEHRMRAFLTMLGVVFGVMSVIAVTAIVQGFFRLYSTQLEGLGAGFLLVFPGNAAAESARKITRLTAADAPRFVLAWGPRVPGMSCVVASSSSRPPPPGERPGRRQQ